MTVLELVPTDEERLLREAVAAICAGFGPEYTREQADAGRAADRALGRARREGLPAASTSPRSAAAAGSG